MTLFSNSLNSSGTIIDVDPRNRNKIIVTLDFGNDIIKKYLLNVSYGKTLFDDDNNTVTSLNDCISRVDELVDSGVFDDKIMKREYTDYTNKFFSEMNNRFSFKYLLLKTEIDEFERIINDNCIQNKNFFDLNFDYDYFGHIENSIYLAFDLSSNDFYDMKIYDGDPNDNKTKTISFIDFVKNDLLDIDWDTVFYKGLIPTDNQCVNDEKLADSRNEFYRIKKCCIRIFNNIPLKYLKKIIVQNAETAMILRNNDIVKNNNIMVEIIDKI